MTDVIDVCIVGSGFAGVLLAQKLVARGLRTVVLEAGVNSGEAGSTPGRFEHTLHRETVPGYQPLTTFKLVGGHSALWGGATIRFSKALFEGRGTTAPLPRWPLRYEELEPHYRQAEEILVGPPPAPPPGASDQMRRSPYLTRFNEILEMRYQFVASATRWSKLRLASALIPALQKSRLFRLVAGATAVEVRMTSRSVARGVAYRMPDGTGGRIDARCVVLACGALQTPRLLLLSRSAFYRNGIGNDLGCVGRHFADHFQVVPSLLCVGDPQLAGERDSFTWKRHWRHRSLHSPFFVLGTGIRKSVTARDVILTERAWGRSLQVLLNERVGTHVELRLLAGMASSRDNRVDLDDTGRADDAGVTLPRLRLRPGAADGATLDIMQTWIRDVYAPFGLKALQFNGEIGGVATFSGGHLSGTCRMGTDPRDSVVDPNLRVHGTRNLFVSGGATFVTGGTENPTLTISALTLRLGDHLVAALRAGDV